MYKIKTHRAGKRQTLSLGSLVKTYHQVNVSITCSTVALCMRKTETPEPWSTYSEL